MMGEQINTNGGIAMKKLILLFLALLCTPPYLGT